MQLFIILVEVFGMFLLLAVLAMVYFKLTVGRRDSWKKPEERQFGTGEKRALYLFQPSNRRHNVPQAQDLAAFLAEQGFSVTMNYPSEHLAYDTGAYDLLVFGSGVYMGETAKPLREYLSDHPFTGKDVLLYVTGKDLSKSPELEALKLLVPEGNRVHAVKVSASDAAALIQFAREHVIESSADKNFPQTQRN